MEFIICESLLYMIENHIDWGNGSAYKKLKEQGIE
jgi:hypothetical protein